MNNETNSSLNLLFGLNSRNYFCIPLEDDNFLLELLNKCRIVEMDYSGSITAINKPNRSNINLNIICNEELKKAEVSLKLQKQE